MRSLLGFAALLVLAQPVVSAVPSADPRHHQLLTGSGRSLNQTEQSPLEKHAIHRHPPLRTADDTVLAAHHVPQQHPVHHHGDELLEHSHLDKRFRPPHKKQPAGGDDDTNPDLGGLTKRDTTDRKMNYHRCASIEGLGIAACSRRHPPRHYPKIIGNNATGDAISVLLNNVVSQYVYPDVNDPFYCIETPAPPDVPAELRKSYKLCIAWNDDKKFDALHQRAHDKIKEYMFNQCITDSGDFMSAFFRLRLDNGPLYSEICFSNQGEKGCGHDIHMCMDIVQKDWDRKYNGSAAEQKEGVPNTYKDYLMGDPELDAVMDTAMAKYGS